MKNNYIKETYTSYDERVIHFLERVYDDVTETNDTLSNYFYCVLDLLANQLKLYFLGVDALNDNSNLSSTDDYKRVSKNPCIAIMDHAHQRILDIMNELALSPFQKAKIKRLSKDDDGESAKELIDKLINE